MRRLIAGVLLLVASVVPAAAAGCGTENPNCIVPNRPAGDSTNAAANTRFVTSSQTNFASLTTGDQTLSGGANVTSDNLGTPTLNSTQTIDCGARPLQYLTDNAAFTLAAPSNDGSCIVFVTNGASAGTITFSGFSVGSNTGDALTTTNTQKFSLFIWRINGTSGYRVAAHQ